MLKQFGLHNILRNADAGEVSGGAATPSSANPPIETTIIDGADDVSGGGNEPEALPVLPAGAPTSKQPTTLEIKATALAEKKALASKQAVRPTTGKPTDEELKEPVGKLDDMDDDNVVRETVAQRKEREDKEVVVTATKAAEVKIAEETKAKDGQRDYSIFTTPEEQALVKTAPNGLFNHLKEVLPKLRTEVTALKTENENLKKGVVKVPDSWREHPNAYVLTPEYNQFATAYRDVSEEESYWLTQLENVENGREWNGLEGRDEKTGNLIAGKAIADNSVRSKDFINQQLALARQYKGQFAGKINEVKQTHQQTFQSAANTIKEGVKTHCPWIANDKLMTEQIEFQDPITNKIQKASVGDTLKVGMEMIPPAFRNHPLAEVWANMFVVNAITQQKVRILEAQLNVKKTNATHQADAEPVGATKGKAATASRKGDDKTIPSTTDMDD